ncbi:hypothetical protein CHS0354_013306 [Potamilus streckersoni]|uniref:Uncharacterized protein n=1 Tax=Potamilus streckersoni TaxID=2493646 RepID=A0AAE0T0C1_9BIVA|nr:hypothetical protein CHS0354_013306 [Potamilus streckersoni]
MKLNPQENNKKLKSDTLNNATVYPLKHVDGTPGWLQMINQVRLATDIDPLSEGMIHIYD